MIRCKRLVNIPLLNKYFMYQGSIGHTGAVGAIYPTSSVNRSGLEPSALGGVIDVENGSFGSLADGQVGEPGAEDDFLPMTDTARTQA